MTFNNYLIFIATSLIINVLNPSTPVIPYVDDGFFISGTLVIFDIRRKYCTFDFK